MVHLFLAVLEKYRAFVIAVVCLISLITSWSNSAVLSAVLLAGVIICPIIGIWDLKEYKSNNR